MITLLLKVFFKLIARVKFLGLENVPLDEPVILTGNHIGMLDGFIIPTIPGIDHHPNRIVIVAEKYEEVPVFGWAIKQLGFIFIDRFNADAGTVRKVLRSLQKDGLLIIAPEGTRSPEAKLIEGKSGAAYLAARSGATVIPFGATGTDPFSRSERLRKFKRLAITINIGAPYHLPPLPKEGREEFLKECTDEIMCRIAAQLPASHRGIYAEHPRLMELLSKN